jgi:hypothetical protein
MAINEDFSRIQSAFAELEGNGISYKKAFVSEETFKNKNPKLLGELIEETAIILEERVKKIEFDEWEEVGADMPYNTLHLAIQRLSELGRALKKRDKIEVSDIDWLLIGELTRITASLLNHINKTR